MGDHYGAGAPEWYPAPEAVKDAGQKIMAVCRPSGLDAAECGTEVLPDYAGAASTLVGLSSREHVERGLKAMELKLMRICWQRLRCSEAGKRCDVGVGIGGELRLMRELLSAGLLARPGLKPQF